MNVGELMVSLALNISDFDRKLTEAEGKGLSFTETLKSVFATADPNINIQVKDGVAEVKIEDFKSLLDTIPDEKVTHLRTTGGGIGGGAGAAGAATAGGGTGPLAGIIAGAIPAIAPVGAAATTAVMGLASAFTAAGAGAVAFGAVAVSNLKGIFTASSNLTKAQDAYNAAVTDKQRQAALVKEQQALVGLNGAQLQAVKSLQSFKSFWDSFAASFQTPVLSLFSQGLHDVETLMTDMKPTITAAAGAFQTLMSQFTKGLGGSQAKDFFNFLAKTAGPDLVSLGDTFGNVIGGILNLMVAFGPTGQSMAASLAKMTANFRDWAASLKGTKGFEDFLKYSAASGKAVLDLIGNLAHLVGTLLKNMAPLGLVMVKTVSDLAKWINQLMTTNPLIKTLVSLVFGAAKNLVEFVDAVIKMFTWLGKTHPVIMDIVTALGFATAAWFALNAVMSMNPITIVIIAIVALVAAGVELVNHWGQVKKFFAGLWSWFTAETTKTWNGIATFFTKTWKDITGGITKAWDAIEGFFKKYGLDILAALTGPIGLLVLFLVKNWSTITSDATNAWNALVSGIKSIISTVVGIVETPFKDISQFFAGLAGEAFQWGANLVGNVVNGIESMIGRVKSAVSNVASAIGNFLGFHSPAKEGPGSDADQWMPNLMNMLVQGVQSGTPKLRTALSGVIGAPSIGGIGSLSPLNTSFSGGGSSGSTRPIIVYLDGREIARGTAPHMVDELRLRTGNKL